MSAPISADVTLRAAQLDDAGSLDAVSELRFTDEGITAAQNALVEPGLSEGARWAAVFLYANGGTDPAPLLPLLDSGDPTITLMAAVGLIARGRPEGFASVINAIYEPDAGTGFLAGSHPPLMRWVFATLSLARYTGRPDLGPPLDAEETMRARSQQQWQLWLSTEMPTLQFHPSAGEWS